MPHPPTVSVLIPTYKYARYLPQAIESVLSQSYGDFELIISDDDSRDGSEDIIRSYLSRDARVRSTIQSPNLGMVRNWNWCLEQARGRYIKYLFGDDYLIHREAIERFVALMETRPDVRLAASARIVVNENSRQIELWNFLRHAGIYDGADVIGQSLLDDTNLFGEPSVVMFRREDAGRGFDPSYKQAVDWEFWVHLLSQGSLAYTDVPLCAFRQHGEQQSAINRETDGARSEHPRLLRQYSQFLQCPEQQLEMLDRLHYLRRARNRSEVDAAMADSLRHALGKNYYKYWPTYRAKRLALKARRLWAKYVQHSLPLDTPPPPYPLFAHTAPDSSVVSYVSCGMQQLHGDGASEPSVQTGTSHPDIQLLGEINPGYSYSRRMPDIVASDEFRRTLLDHYDDLDRRFRTGAASWLAEIGNATLAHNVLYVGSGDARSVVYETHRPTERSDAPLLTTGSIPTPYPVQPNTVCFFLGSMGSNTYGHWLTDDLPRLAGFHLLRSLHPDRTIEIVLSSQGRLDQCMHWNALRAASIRALLGYEENYRIGFVNLMRPFSFERLYYPTPTSYHPVLKSPEGLRNMAERLTHHGRDSAKRKVAEKIFVMRRAGRRRVLQNMTAIAGTVRDLGYRIVDTETMSITDQALAFASARVVAGTMGSAMTNTVFCRPGTRVIHLAPEGWLEPYYWDLAAVRGHNYSACYGPAIPTPGLAAMTSFSVPEASLQRILREAG